MYSTVIGYEYDRSVSYLRGFSNAPDRYTLSNLECLIQSLKFRKHLDPAHVLCNCLRHLQLRVTTNTRRDKPYPASRGRKS